MCLFLFDPENFEWELFWEASSHNCCLFKVSSFVFLRVTEVWIRMFVLFSFSPSLLFPMEVIGAVNRYPSQSKPLYTQVWPSYHIHTKLAATGTLSVSCQTFPPSELTNTSIVNQWSDTHAPVVNSEDQSLFRPGQSGRDRVIGIIIAEIITTRPWKNCI